MKISEYMSQAGVPEKFLHADLSDTEFFKICGRKDLTAYKKIYRACIKIVEDAEVGALLIGQAGSGKSFLGAAMLRHYLKQGRKSARTTAAEISDYYFEDYQGLRARYTDADVLFIEDLTKCGINGKANSQILEKLIKQRDDDGKLTLYSCYSDADIKNKFSHDIYRLIKGTAVNFQMPAVDLRQLVLQEYANKIKGE